MSDHLREAEVEAILDLDCAMDGCGEPVDCVLEVEGALVGYCDVHGGEMMFGKDGGDNA